MPSTTSRGIPVKAIFSNEDTKPPSMDLAQSFKDDSTSFRSSCVFSIASNSGPPSSAEMPSSSLLAFSNATRAELGAVKDASDSYAERAETIRASAALISSRISIKRVNRDSSSSDSPRRVPPHVALRKRRRVRKMPPPSPSDSSCGESSSRADSAR
jgi:hypothetical protein